VNRKLIRTTLAEVKEREMHAQQTRRAPEPPPPVERPAPPTHERPERDRDRERERERSTPAPSHAQSSQPKKKIPPEQTNAENFYYKKQMDAHTPMVLVLQDNEHLYGTIEWYDKNSIKLHRDEGPNLLVLKHNIKYMYKDQSEDDE